jgi:hypothetical protein
MYYDYAKTVMKLLLLLTKFFNSPFNTDPLSCTMVSNMVCASSVVVCEISILPSGVDRVQFLTICEIYFTLSENGEVVTLRMIVPYRMALS